MCLRPWQCSLCTCVSCVSLSATQVAVLQLVLSGQDRLGDPTPLAGRRFEVELPAPRNGQAEFVVLRARFEASLRAAWRPGDRCQLYFGDDGGGGRWWLGTVVADARADHPRSHRVLSAMDPRVGEICWEDDGLWERYTLAWHAPDPYPDPGGGAAAAAEPSRQSPWEMFRPGTDAEAARAEAPNLADEVAARALGAVEALMAAPRFRLFVDALQPGDCYPADPDGRALVWYTEQARPTFLLLGLAPNPIHSPKHQPTADCHEAVAAVWCTAGVDRQGVAALPAGTVAALLKQPGQRACAVFRTATWAAWEQAHCRLSTLLFLGGEHCQHVQ